MDLGKENKIETLSQYMHLHMAYEDMLLVGDVDSNFVDSN